MTREVPIGQGTQKGHRDSHTLRTGGWGGSASRSSAAAGWGHRPCMKGAATKKVSDLWRHFLFSSELKRASCLEYSAGMVSFLLAVGVVSG